MLPVFLCLSAGAAISWLTPPVYVAASRVEVDPGTGGSVAVEPSRRQSLGAVRTQIEVIRSEMVLRLAAQKLRLSSTEELKRSVSAVQVGVTSVIEIRVSRSQAEQAKLWANAITDAYVEFKRASAISNSIEARRLIERGIQNAETRIATLGQQISTNPANAGDLRQQQSSLTAQLRSLQAQLRDLPQAETVVKGDVTILATAQTPRAPIRPRPLRNMGFAAAGGAAIGAPLAILALRRRRAQRSVEPPESQSLQDHEQEFDTAGGGRPAAALRKSRSDDLAVARSEPTPTGGLSQQLANLAAHFNRSLEAYARHILGELSARQEVADARLAEAVQGMASSPAGGIDHVLGESRRPVLDEITAKQEALAAEMRTLSEKLEMQNEGQASRLLGPLKQMSLQMGALQERLSGDFQGFRDSVTERVDAGRADIENAWNRRDEESSLRWTKVAVQIAQGIQQLRAEMSDKMNEQLERIAIVAEEIRGSNQVRYLEDRLDRMEQDSLDRLSKVAGEVTRNLQGLREEISEKVAWQQESTRRMAESVASVEAKLIGSNGLTGRMGGLFEWVGGQIKAVDARVISAVEQINAGLQEGVQSNRAELAERLGGVDAEVSERLGRVAVKLSESLDRLRSEISDKTSSHQKTIATMLESLESRRAGESMDTTRRLGALLEESGRQMRAVESAMVRALSEVKADVLDEVRRREGELGDQFSKTVAEMTGRLENIAAQMDDKLNELSAKSAKRVTAQLETISGRLQALEGEIADQSAAVAKRLSARLKALEQAIGRYGITDAELDSNHKTREAAAGRRKIANETSKSSGPVPRRRSVKAKPTGRSVKR